MALAIIGSGAQFPLARGYDQINHHSLELLSFHDSSLSPSPFALPSELACKEKPLPRGYEGSSASIKSPKTRSPTLSPSRTRSKTVPSRTPSRTPTRTSGGNPKKRSNERSLEKLPTLDLMDKLEQTERKLQALLAAGEEVIQSSSCSDSASTPRSHIVEESPLGFQWEVPDFSDVLSIVARNNEPPAKRGPSEDIADSSPSKRARSLTEDYQGISEQAKRLTSMMAGMSEHLSRLSDPQYLDDLVTHRSSASQRSDPDDMPDSESKVRSTNLTQHLDQLSDLQFLDTSTPQLQHPQSKVNDEVQALREENRKLQASLAEAQREKTEMSKVLVVLEDSLAKSNEYLRDQAKQPKCTVGCGNALLSLQAQQRHTTGRAIISGR